MIEDALHDAMRSRPTHYQENTTTALTFMKTDPSQWLLAMWKEIDDKTFGKGFDCLGPTGF